MSRDNIFDDVERQIKRETIKVGSGLFFEGSDPDPVVSCSSDPVFLEIRIRINPNRICNPAYYSPSDFKGWAILFLCSVLPLYPSLWKINIYYYYIHIFNQFSGWKENTLEFCR